MKKILGLVLVALGVTFIAGFYFYLKPKSDAKNQNIIPTTIEEGKDSLMPMIEKREDTKTNNEKTVFKDKTIVKVPFVLQAPFGLWDEVHEEMCEEASLLMLYQLFSGQTLTLKEIEQELQKMAQFEKKHYGSYTDSDMEGIVRLAKDFYGEKFSQHLKIIYPRDFKEINSFLSNGQPVLLPTAGRLLHNPNFTPPGPWYHNLILVGYDKNGIITNDPGTRRGEGYRYSQETLWQALHDFPGKKENIESGEKVIIVYFP